MTTPLLLFGAGRMGQQLAALVRNQFAKQYQLVGYADDTRKRGEAMPDGLPVLGTLQQAAEQPPSAPGTARLLFAIGYGDMRARLAAHERALKANYRLATLIHPRAHVEPDVELGEGCCVHAGALLDTGCRLGAANFVDIGVMMGERVQMGSANYISAGSVVGGNLTMGNGNFLGMSAVLRDGIRVGSFNTVPAQALVHRDLAAQVQVMEARTIRFVGPSDAN